MELKIGADIMENKMEVPPKKLKIELSCDAAIHILSIYLETPKTVIQNDMRTYLLICTIIYKSQDMETDQVSTDG